ncbi:NAD-dependent histone deacetylase sir2 [Friedmanniomyces endolithicus]|uniref:NAD-dependent histone deacetylase sir2 n=1 Tax=Friedmanniomyces endolithicus TaxID=329885 RepID=A0AAN6FVL2_9PEZI|nr:NAD-dependent histone deacetylase sir2 [Friedmanniomyces endolithicus]KAK0288609.1 NAD-dependent histone deacetylase sir2 [Friedmanniomyces endolithicus]KAK0323637.1 NAD-dependent histone deacetylase sir2 [Friedmanniomyces endolithicus]KAK1006367.1 NAD-dependent histone deacetylase sir2 [Friedmanniomyces endolithicus]
MGSTEDQPLLPTVATPRAQLKRKHHEIIDLTADDEDTIRAPLGVRDAQKDQSTMQRRLGDDEVESESQEEEDEDDTVVDDYLDHFEMQPYVAGIGSTDGLSQDRAIALCTELRQTEPGSFMAKYLTSSVMSPRLLGTAFGIDPDLAVDDDVFMRILGNSIVRAHRKRQKLIQHNTIDDAAKLLRRSRKIMVLTGAGISTSLGIPDFRSKGTGFYDKVRSLGYSAGEEVFDIIEFDRDPSVFYSLAGDILPDLNRFSPTHAFIKLLQDKGRLQTNYTQNIDNLEELAGIDRKRLIQCHGSFATASCRKCGDRVPGSTIFADLRAKRVAKCKRCEKAIAEQAKQPKPPPLPTKKKPPSKFKLRKNDWESSSGDDEDDNIPSPGIMKPDITFFHEKLPDTFFDRFTEQDSKDVDLVLVIGTSLKVAPVSEMPHHLPAEVPHIFISREAIEHVNFDVQLLGECDDVCFELCRRAGWGLRHEMIPKGGLQVVVRPVEGSTCRWSVVPVGKMGASATPQRASNGAGIV